MTAFEQCPRCSGQKIPSTYVGDVFGAVCWCPLAVPTVIHAPFRREHCGSMADEILAVVYTYAGRVGLAEALGVLEIVKQELYRESLDEGSRT